ncbi:MAG: DNA polymerase III subunit alpha [Chitinophagales bacterium]
MYLNCHTYYSMRYGSFSEKTLLELAQQNGIRSIALTDINNTSACLNFIQLAQKQGIKPIVGIDFRNGNEQQYIGIAQNNEGFLELNNHLSQHLHNELLFDYLAPNFNHVFVVYPFKKAEQILQKNLLKPYEFIGVKPEELNKIPFSILKKYPHKCVVQQIVSFRNKRDFNTHRLLRSIDKNTLLSKLPKNEEADEHEVMYPVQQLKYLYKDYPQIIYNTEKLLDECNIYFDFSKDRKSQNLETYTGSIGEDVRMLKQLCYKGLPYRYGNSIPETIYNRLEKELEIVQKMGFVSYFLTNWDIVNYAQSKNYFYVGRGSGANSIIAYLLKITDVDPIELDLFFERFINLFRTNPPDFDLDFSWRDREDLTRYIFERFNNVALLATYNTFQYKAAVRELGKVFGLPKQEIDKLCDGKYDVSKLDQLSVFVLSYARQLHEMPNYLSIHAGGILIAEKPIHYFSATNMPPKGFSTTQFDMVIAEDVGLFKYDILGQRGLAKIKETLSIITYNQPNNPPEDIHNINHFKTDKNINNLIKEAQCIGCFYVESPAMRMLLKKLRVDNYLGLVAASSIIRPGVAKSGMMREYILRLRETERVKKRAHPIMLSIMPDTFGIMVYQEDVIKVAHYFAGLTLGEADVLRRGMSGKYRSREEFEKVKQTYFNNCKEKGYDNKSIQEIWFQIESFAGYAFAKGHSASYAVESYQALYLKTYYPLEYMVAIINNGGGFYQTELYIHEARMLGATIHAPHINISRSETIIKGKDIYLGLSWLRGLDTSLARKIVRDREEFGFYESLENFVDRISIGMEHLAILVRIGAFDCTGIHKRSLLWKAHVLWHSTPKLYRQTSLFKAESKQFSLPSLTSTDLEDVFDQIELLGFTLGNPFDLLETLPKNKILAKDFPSCLNRTIAIYGYFVAVKNTPTSGGERMNFGTFLDQTGQFIDTIHFPNSAKRYPFRGRGVYLLIGKVTEEFGFYTLEVSEMEKCAYVPDARYRVNSKDWY